MATSSIPVDLFNPGQIFACIGFMEAAEILCGGAAAGFDWREAGRERFLLGVNGDDDPFEAVLSFLENASVHSIAPHGSRSKTDAAGVPTIMLPPGAPFPYPDPDEPATLPAVLSNGRHNLIIDHWGDSSGSRHVSAGRDNVKFWAGMGGFPGAALALKALELARPYLASAAADPFSVSALQTSSFRFDWRRDYIPLDAGFSLNYSHPTTIQPVGYPIVELMAAIGLSHARPRAENKLEYRYGVIGGTTDNQSAEMTLLPPIFIRAALGCGRLPFATRVFRMNLDWPGKEGQARCITSVAEEAA